MTPSRLTLNRLLLTVFLGCLVAAAVLGVVFVYFPAALVAREKLLSASILATLIGAGIFLDLLAFRRGATATFSQDILGWTRASRVFGAVLLILTGIVLGHLMLAHDQGIPRDRSVAHYVLVALPLLALGMWIGATLLSQRSDSD